jgi:hypothetical protein
MMFKDVMVKRKREQKELENSIDSNDSQEKLQNRFGKLSKDEKD